MTTWTNDELAKIGDAEELRIAPLRRDGTQRTPVPVWVVRDGERLHVRSYRGINSAWYRAALATGTGQIQANGADKDVTFQPETDPDVNDQIDAAYRSKYARYGASYVAAMLAPEARATTLRVMPS